MKNCDYCQKEIERTVFCSPKCRVYHFREKKFGIHTEVTNSNKEETPVTISNKPFKKQVLNCKKHHGSSSCGCVE